jgi:nucleotide-binding universal stress UspA family protein
MLAVKNILLPVAFSDRCRGAARYAMALASHFDSHIVLIHSLESTAFASRGFEGVALPESWFSEQRARMEKELHKFFTQELRRQKVKCLVVEGDPAHEIVRHAHAENVDLIVMPTHGYGPFRRFLLGSVTAKVLHDADCPVLTGPHMEAALAGETVSFRKVLCAIDLEARSEAVLKWGGAFAESYAADLDVVYAIPMTEVRLGGIYFDPEWRTQAADDARTRMNELCGAVKPPWKAQIEFGDAPGVVADVAERLGADLLVIGRSHEAGIAGRLRANAYAIVREAPCAVVSV